MLWGGSAKSRWWPGAACALVAALAFAALVASALAAFGRVDRSFGEGGIARPDLGPTYGNAMLGALAAQPDGGVLATMSVVPYPPKPQQRRYLANGQLDPAFPPRETGASLEVPLADGGSLAVSEGGDRIWRRKADGSTDPGFADGGRRTLPISVRKVVPLENGKVLLAGVSSYFSSTKAPPINQIGVMRLNPDGSPDSGFDGDGLVSLRSAHGIVGQNVGALAVRSGEGALVAVNAPDGLGFGEAQKRTPGAEATLAALGTDGALDAGFGDKGTTKRSGSIAGVNVLAGGEVLVAGSKSGAQIGCCYAQSDFWLGRLTPDGRPDPSFGSGGEAIADLGGTDIAETALWDDDGSILLGGASIAATPSCVQLIVCEEAPALARFTANGALDTGFGEGGKLRLQTLAGRAPYLSKGVLSLAARPAGGVFAGGGSGPDAFIAALGENGVPDPAFGSGGIVTERLPSPSRTFASTAAVDPQGRILLAAKTDAGNTGLYPDGALARLLPDGRLDPAFGAGRGYLELPVEPGDLAVDEAERTVVLGEGGGALTRVGTDGTIDRSFGEDGIVLPAIQLGLNRLGFNSVAALPGGGTVIAGQVVLSGAVRTAVVRLHPDGSIDRSFGSGGIAVNGFGRGRSCGVNKVLVQPDGRILLAGYVGKHGEERGQNSGVALLRLLPDGSLDPRFGQGGRLPGRVGRDSEATDLALVGGKILVAGWLRRSGKLTTLLLRLRPNGRRDRGFGRGGVSRAASISKKRSRWPWATSLTLTPRRIVVFRGTSARPLLAYRRNGRLERSFGGAKLMPNRLAEGWAAPNPVLTSQAGAPILVWTDWGASRGVGPRTLALRRLLPR